MDIFERMNSELIVRAVTSLHNDGSLPVGVQYNIPITDTGGKKFLISITLTEA